MVTTCQACLCGTHYRCRGCACSICERSRRVVRPTPPPMTVRRPPARTGPRHGSQGQNNPNPGNFSDPLPVDRLVGVLESIRIYQLTGVLPSQQQEVPA